MDLAIGQFLPSQLFVQKSTIKHLDNRCSMNTVDQTQELENRKIEAFWDFLYECDKTEMPYNRLVAAMIFYSATFRMRLLSKDLSTVTVEEFKSIQGEWTDLVKCDLTLKSFEYCVCGHEIARPFFLRNTLNSNVLKVSGDCICRFGNSLIVEAVKITRENARYTGQFKMCGYCYGHKIPPNEEWRTVCPDCFRHGFRDVKQAYSIAMFYRICKECGKSAIACNAESFKDTCVTCFKAKNPTPSQTPAWSSSASVNDLGSILVSQPINAEVFKKCIQCGIQSIPVSAGWKKKCDACFASSGAAAQTGEKVACQKCGQKKIAADKAHLFKLCFTCNQSR